MRAAVLVIVALCALAVLPAVASAETLATGDFDGNGVDDLAIGSPYEALGVLDNPGAVNVIYGSGSGLAAPGNQVWHQDTPGIKEVAEPTDFFGISVVAGDFDGDDIDDLAVGAALESFGGHVQPGVVHVIYGSPAGLAAAGNQLWSQDSPGIREVAEGSGGFGDRFGWALAAGDFDGDAADDLAISTQAESFGGHGLTGVVQMIYGSPAGLTSDGNQLWHQDSPGIREVAEGSELFGDTLAAADFDGDGLDDLAIGALGEGLGGNTAAGVVHVIYGSAGGLDAAGNQVWSQDSPGVIEVAEEDDRFGEALAAGDFDGNGIADLAIGAGAQGEDLGAKADAGVVHTLYGAAGDGLTATGNQLWHQDSLGILEVAEGGDYFGDALAAGDFDGDGADDLMIGLEFESFGGLTRPGVAQVVYGSVAGLAAARNQLWHQDSAGILEVAETFDSFGNALAAGDFDDDGVDDAAIGASHEGFGGNSAAGVLHALYGAAATGLTATDNQLWSQDSPGILEVAEGSDFFGGVIP